MLESPMPALRWAVYTLLSLTLAAACTARPEAARGGEAASSSRPAAAAAAGATSGASVSAPTAAPAPAGDRAPQRVSVGVLGATSDAPVYIAQERGYFREQGLEVELIPFANSLDQPPLLSTGQLDVGGGAMSSALYNAMARGLAVKIVADRTRTVPGRASNVLAVRKDLVDSGQVRDWPDLRGRNLAQPNAQYNVIIHSFLQRGGLTIDDVNATALSYPDMLAAMANGRIDAAIIIEPFVALGARQGISVRWKGFDEAVPEYETAVEMFGAAMTEDQPRAERFMIAYVKGARDYVNAVVHGRGKPELVSILVQNTSVKDPTLYDEMVLGYLNPDGHVGADLIAQDLAWYRERGLLQEPTPLDIRDVVDNRFADAAVNALGRYTPPQ
jgi:NitT/TauT family transport system substrate-binding protein